MKLLGSELPDVKELSRFVASKIRKEIEDQGMKEKEFALKHGKAPAWISQKLLHARNLTVEDVEFFATSLGVPASSFLPISGYDLSNVSFIDLIRSICLDAIKEYGKEPKK